MQRRVWKTDLLAQIDRAEAAPAIPLPADPSQFAKVRVTGHLAPGPIARYGAEVRDLPGGPVFGTQVITPLDRLGADPVLVDRGWAPLGQTLLPSVDGVDGPPGADTIDGPPGADTIDGYIRTPDTPGLFSARDDPATLQFYTLDPKVIGAALGLPHVAPFTLVALGAVAPGVFPQPATALPRPPNDHLNYALTWFGLASAPRRRVHRLCQKGVPPVTTSADAAYARLTSRFARVATLGEAAAVLGWDAAAMMPPGGGAARAEQLAVLAGLAHQQLTDPAVGGDLDEADVAPEPGPSWREANLCLMRHAYVRATAVPADLVEASARANSHCEKVWREARRTSDFTAVAPYLAEVVNLVRQGAAAMAPALGLSPYDALMDGFQPGITAADVVPVFTRYQRFVVDALPRAEARQARAPAPLPLPGPFPPASRRRCAVSCRNVRGWISATRGWTALPTRSAAARRSAISALASASRWGWHLAPSTGRCRCWVTCRWALPACCWWRCCWAVNAAPACSSGPCRSRPIWYCATSA